MKTYGTRAEVMHGTAKETTGHLKKSNLKMIRGRIVSKAASKSAKQQLKTSKFKKFTELMKKGKMKLAPKKGTKAYKQIMKTKK